MREIWGQIDFKPMIGPASFERNHFRVAINVPLDKVTAQWRAGDERLVNEVGDDREDIQSGDRILMIVENDLGFARFLLDAARDSSLKRPFLTHRV